MNRLSTILCSLVLAALPSASALADTVYTYTGNNYTTANGPFNTTESIQGSFTLASPLGLNFTYHPIAPTQFSFSDGRTTITNATSEETSFTVSTNAAGDISTWAILVVSHGIGGSADSIQTFYVPTIGPNAEYDEGAYVPPNSDGGFDGINHQDPGTWTISTTGPPSPIPEPSSLLMLFTGAIGGIGTLRRKLTAQKCAC